MVRVAIVGLGFMGRMHFRCYKNNGHAQLAAICDTDENKLKKTSQTAGNVPGAKQPLDLTGIELYTDFDKMLKEAKLDAVSITLPTYLHKDYTIKAIKAGLHVLCEKPMALDVTQCKAMIAAAKKNGKILQIGHCLRFWPEYAKIKEIVDSGQYGKVKAATFQRLSLPPTWSWENWLLQDKKSGGALMDLHIHDTDYIQYVFGMPKAVSSHAVTGPSGGFDHVVTSYIYNGDKVITAEGGWVMTPSFGFEMSCNIILEKATLVYDLTRDPIFKLCLLEGKPVTPHVEGPDGYVREIDHFLRTIKGEKLHRY